MSISLRRESIFTRSEFYPLFPILSYSSYLPGFLLRHDTMAGSTDLVSLCSASSFPFPDLPGAQLDSITASPVHNFSGVAPEYYYFNHPTVTMTNSTFCNVTISYTHPGQGDLVTVNSYLPISSPSWNRRFQAVGGGGWQAGMWLLTDIEMIGALGGGYATITTDAGVSGPVPDDWALVSEGNVNLYALQNFASVSLRDQAVIGKSLIESFYGEGPSYSYWSGCSTGGRQGLMLAQRYPDLYDGIAASAPGINWSAFLAGHIWSKVVLNTYLNGIEPDRCELNEVTARAIEFCDELDGFVDGLISDDEACYGAFDPKSLVGSSFLCASTNQTATISQEAITFAEKLWEGPRAADGSFIWYGRTIGAPLADNNTDFVIDNVASRWVRFFVEKDSSYDLDNITLQEYEWQSHRAIAEFDDIIGTNDANLKEFHRQGHKMLTFHGLMDPQVSVKNTRHYYNAVSDTTPDVHKFYRLFDIPGMNHCYGGSGGQPTSLFETLRNWVEDNTTPEKLPITFTEPNGDAFERIVCPYPQKTLWDEVGDIKDPSSFYCA